MRATIPIVSKSVMNDSVLELAEGGGENMFKYK
jgi:hypothetical protein